MSKNTFINQAEISHYLKDVRKRKVLTPDREKELAKMMLNPMNYLYKRKKRYI